MKKVIQRRIDHQYLPVAPTFLKVGSTIDFDCYIKRYNGYVIVIHAGTTVTESLYKQIMTHARIYIEQSQRDQYRNYREKHQENGAEDARKEEDEGPALPVGELSAAMQKLRAPEERIKVLYRSGIALMERCFEGPDPELPMEELTQFAKILADFVASGRHRFIAFLEKMSDLYSEPNHAVNVAILAVILAKALKMEHRDLEDIAFAGLLHDIGKRKVDKQILDKAAELDDDEYVKVREHVPYSIEITKEAKIVNSRILSAIRYHHERLDGSGYPNRLVGNQIPVMAQIIGLCDIFDALTTDRTYRARYSSFEALRLMKRDMAKQINGTYVDHLIRLLGS